MNVNHSGHVLGTKQNQARGNLVFVGGNLNGRYRTHRNPKRHVRGNLGAQNRPGSNSGIPGLHLQE
jgi:hypothetical protein